MDLFSAAKNEDLRLGVSEQSIELSGAEDNRLAALLLARQARRSLVIMSRDLDAPIFDDEDFVEAVKGLALATRGSHVHILVRDVARIVRDGHRLLELVRRLPSFMAMRVPAPEHESYNSAFVIADRTGVIFRKHADRYEGTVGFADRREAENLARLFDEMWETAREHPDLRQIRI